MAELTVEIKFVRRPYNGQWAIDPDHIKADTFIGCIFLLFAYKINKAGNLIRMNNGLTLFIPGDSLKDGAIGKS